MDVGLQISIAYLGGFFDAKYAKKYFSQLGGRDEKETDVDILGLSGLEILDQEFEPLEEIGLVLTSVKKRTYSVQLSRPSWSTVYVDVDDEDGCFEMVEPSEFEITPEKWNIPQLVTVRPEETCVGRLRHNLFSKDTRYNGLHIRAQPLTEFNEMAQFPENLGEGNGHSDETSVAANEESTETRTGNKASPQGDLREPEFELEGMQPLKAYEVAGIPFKRIVKDYNCVPTSQTNKALKCTLAQGTNFVTHFYILSEEKLDGDLESSAPLVLITSGVHGKELAGFGAGGIIKGWKPFRGRIIVIDRMNARGIEKHTRYVPDAQMKDHDDLNRDFPANFNRPERVLAAEIWKLCELLHPRLFLDLHEGWGYYARLKSQDGKEPSSLVGNPKFSKGSSIIATENALEYAQMMVDIVNQHVKERLHKFEVLSPPISGGLARRVHNAFGAQSFVLETTIQHQALEKRIMQHLQMVSGLLIRIGFLDAGFRPAKVKSRKQSVTTTASKISL